jgi:ABC-type phosphate transport system auxiliary subunit
MRPGLIRDFPGNLSDYRAYVEQGLWGNSEEENTAKGGQSKDETVEKEARIREREQRKKLQRVVEKLEREIESCEAELSRLKLVLHDPANALNHVLLHETAQTIDLEQAELDDRLREWERWRSELEVMNTE